MPAIYRSLQGYVCEIIVIALFVNQTSNHDWHCDAFHYVQVRTVKLQLCRGECEVYVLWVQYFDSLNGINSRVTEVSVGYQCHGFLYSSLKTMNASKLKSPLKVLMFLVRAGNIEAFNSLVGIVLLEVSLQVAARLKRKYGV